MTDAFRGSRSFLEELCFHYDQTESGMRGEFTVTPTELAPGHNHARVSVLASVADVLMGVPVSFRKNPSLALTVDLSVRISGPIGVGTFQIDSRIVKLGASLSATEARFHDGNQTVAHCWGTFMASPRPQDTLVTLPMHRQPGHKTLSEPFPDALGLRAIEPGVVEVDRRPYTMQSSGTIQGGVVCAMAEVAAESVLGGSITEIDVRYLSTIRVGPGRTTTEQLNENLAVVSVVDADRTDGRVAAIAFARH